MKFGSRKINTSKPFSIIFLSIEKCLLKYNIPYIQVTTIIYIPQKKFSNT